MAEAKKTPVTFSVRFSHGSQPQESRELSIGADLVRRDLLTAFRIPETARATRILQRAPVLAAIESELVNG